MPDICKSSGKLRRADLVKIKFSFSLDVKELGASLKTLILFRLFTKSSTIDYIGNFLHQVD